MNWIKRNWRPLGLLLGGSIIMAGLVAFILARREDRGFVEAQCAADGPTRGYVRWAKEDAPIRVVAPPDGDDLIKFASYAGVRWNSVANTRVFDEPKKLSVFGRSRCEEKGSPEDPVVFLIRSNIDGTDRDERAHAHLFWDRSCKLRCAEVYFPALAKERYWGQVMTHEYGHALGLAHDDFDDSVMYHGGKAMDWGVDVITESDQATVRDAFK